MKGGLAAAAIAIRAAHELGIEPKRPVLLQSVIGEETGGLGTLAAIIRGYRADAAVIAEPTGLAMCPVASGALLFSSSGSRLRHPRRHPCRGGQRGRETVDRLESTPRFRKRSPQQVSPPCF